VVSLKRVVVIGGNAAGMSAASQVKRQKPDWDVTVYEKGRFISYAACGIPYHVGGLVSGLDDLISVTPEDAVEERKLNLKMHHEVTAIDPQTKTVTVSADSVATTEHYDYLVIATGAQPLKAAVDYHPSERVFTVHSLNDSEAMRDLIKTGAIKKCAVIGGGYIAVEMLEALKKQGIETHLIHRRDELSRTFEKEISDIAMAEIAREGIILNLNQSVSRVEAEDSMVKVHTDKDLLTYDLVIVAVGVEPNSDLAKDCGIKTGTKGSIKVDQHLRTNIPDIYAAGDCTETTDIVSGRPIYVPLALKANKEGVVAGINICGGNETFTGVLGTAIMKFCELGLARTGLTLADAESAGFEAIKYSVTSNSKAHYFPGGGKLTAVLTADKKTGRLLGAQLAGPVDGVKRIDTYATAITAKMTLDDIFQLDLAYAPPFSPVYDPVVLTGRVGRKKVGG
jgi:CoA-dependent NAD(P)H sulfur oxidoreductase